MNKSIAIPFKRKSISSTIFNYMFILGGGSLVITACLKEGPGTGILLALGGCIGMLGGYWESKGTGIRVDIENQLLNPYTTNFGLKKTTASFSFKDIDRLLVSTGAEAHGRTSLMGSKSSVSYKVFKLSLMPALSFGKDRIQVGIFYTQEECMEAAEALSKASGLNLELRIR